MAENTLSKTEYEAACNMLKNILEQPVDEIELTDSIPPINDIADSNQVFKGKLSVLFVDMRKSTDLTDELKSKKMVKIYRSFIRLIVQAIRYCGGQSRQFAGDGVMGVFQDSIDNEIKESSADKAVRAARYIITLIDFCLNPYLKKWFNDIVIGCGVGICTGIVMATKVGMRGKEADETAENEMGIVWVGSTTNYASRFCSLAKPREIFIDENTCNGITTDTGLWNKETRVKGTKSFTGYTVKDYYLTLPNNVIVEPICSDETPQVEMSFVQQIFDETEKNALRLIDEISKKSAELSVALENIKHREEQVSNREKQLGENENRVTQGLKKLQETQERISEADLENKRNEYRLNRDIFSTAYPSDSLIKQLGKDFWCPLIQKMYSFGASIQMTKENVIIDLNYYLIDIYFDLEMFKEAYDVLCVCANYDSKILFRNFEIIVKKSGHWLALKENLEARLKQSNISEFEEALKKLKDMGY